MIDIKSTGVTRMPLYACKDAIAKFKEEAKTYPYWVIKEDRWYDPEGLHIPQDLDIKIAGTREECLGEIARLTLEAEREGLRPDWWNRDKTVEVKGEDFVTIYYPHAIAKATFRVIENKEAMI